MLRMPIIVVSREEGVGFASSLQGQRFSTICVEVAFHFLVTDFHTNSQHVLFVVQASNFTEGFSGFHGRIMRESITSVSAILTALSVILQMRSMD